MTVPKEIIELSVMLGTYPTSVVILMRFLVLKTPRHTMRLNIGGVFPLSYHLIIKFPTSPGFGCIKDDQHASKKCYIDSIQAKDSLSIMILDVEPPRGQIKPLDMT